MTADEMFLQEVIQEAVLHADVISTMPDGATKTTPFWKARWEIIRAQEEREWERRQHPQDGWERWETPKRDLQVGVPPEPPPHAVRLE